MLPLAPPSWQHILRSNFTQLESLCNFLQLNEDQKKQLILRKDFTLNLPVRLANKIQKGTLEDPILKQFVPTIAEKTTFDDFSPDPLQELACRPNQKLLHKYQGRVLLVCTSACAMHCRYCFRQSFPYATQQRDFNEELHYIANDPSIREVILSGGDPLSLSNDRLQALLIAIDNMPHIKRIRFHSRFPVGIPERIDQGLCNILATLKKQVWFVIHVNHPNEIDQDLLNHLSLLRKQGVILLNQSVLLRGINDSLETLATLFETLADNGILPYYLHQLDKVQGAAHFEVPLEEGRRLMRQLESRVSGYVLPKYVQEVAGEPAKQRIVY